MWQENGLIENMSVIPTIIACTSELQLWQIVKPEISYRMNVLTSNKVMRRLTGPEGYLDYKFYAE